MPYSSRILDILFLFSVSIIWVMIVYQLILTIFGNRYRRRTEKEWWKIDDFTRNLPPVSILIPARNEEVVIGKTLKKILSTDYPEENIEVIVVNDGSTDRTETILTQMASQDSRIHPVHLPVAQSGRGKARALNVGLKHASHDVIAVYDADNNPEPDALRMLVMGLISDDKLGAVIGKFRTLNRGRNLLTRFINIETLSFQWILQAGRYLLFKVAILPGTNFVIRRDVLESCGGWDEGAITEDAELSVRIYQRGWKIKFLPTAVTWEQEPEKWRTWIRQRTRWVRGNNYVLRKLLGQSLLFKNGLLSLEFIYLFGLYYLFLGAIVVSHLLFLLCGLGILSVSLTGPYTGVWVSAFLMYLLEIILVLSFEDEDSPLNILITALMYFTYCQMWIYVVFRAFYLDITRKRLGVWDKTERFPQVTVPAEKESEPCAVDVG
jgi:cellulose synthase/poly-beta-1,6-N-acetylglucosamine synthase-like glycosyltransferase